MTSPDPGQPAVFRPKPARGSSRAPVTESRRRGGPAARISPASRLERKSIRQTLRVVDVEPAELPAEVQPRSPATPSERRRAAPARRARPRGTARRGERRPRATRKPASQRLVRRPEQPRRRLHPDQRVVLAVLVRVDRVVEQRPGDAGRIEQRPAPQAEPAGVRRPAEQRAPVEGEPEEDLRPPGEPLGEGIDRDQRQRADRRARSPARGKLRRIAKATSACATIQAAACRGVTCPDGSGRERVRATRASMSRSVRSFQVQPAPRIRTAPSAQPSGDPEVVGRSGPPGSGRGGEQEPPPAGDEQEPGADRPVGARQPQVGPRQAAARSRSTQLPRTASATLPSRRPLALVCVASWGEVWQKPRRRSGFLSTPPSAPAPRCMLAPDQAHYLFNVMRAAHGAEVARLQRPRRRVARPRSPAPAASAAAVTCRAPGQPQRRPPDLWLVFAPIKKARTDFIVEKAAELGAARVLPVFTRHSNDRAHPARAAARPRHRGGRAVRRDLRASTSPRPVRLDGAARRLGPGAAPRSSATSRATPPRPPTALAAAAPGPWAILIGPEGGFAPEETARLRGAPLRAAGDARPARAARRHRRLRRADALAGAARGLAMSFIRPELAARLHQWREPIGWARAARRRRLARPGAATPGSSRCSSSSACSSPAPASG